MFAAHTTPTLQTKRSLEAVYRGSERDAVLLDARPAKQFHHTVAKVQLGSIQARPGLLTALSFLTSCVNKAPNTNYNKELLHMLSNKWKLLICPLILSSQGWNIIKWWINASYPVFTDTRSETCAFITLYISGDPALDTDQNVEI
jgi:hypothetical protein